MNSDPFLEGSCQLISIDLSTNSENFGAYHAAFMLNFIKHSNFFHFLWILWHIWPLEQGSHLGHPVDA